MAINNEKVDEMTLALLYLTTFNDTRGEGVEEPCLGCSGSPAREGLHSRPGDEGEVGEADRGRGERSKRLFEGHFITDGEPLFPRCAGR